MRTNLTPPSTELIAARVESHDWQMSQALLMCVAWEWDLKRTIDAHFSGVSPQRQAIFKDLIRRFTQVRKEALVLNKEIDSELKSRFIYASEELFCMKTPKPQFKRLQPLIDQGCCLLPCGANKNPLIKS